MPSSFPVDVHIWYQDTESLDKQSLELANHLLCQEEQAQRDRFHFHEDRRDFAVAHSLLRKTLSKHAPDCRPADWRFEKDVFGKPYISGESRPTALEFNLSHTTGFVACAISSARVGIDVESVRQNMDYVTLVRNQFSCEEFKMVMELPTDTQINRVIELWTLKEAFVKAIGRGLSSPLDSIRFELGPQGAIRFHGPPNMDASSWQFALFTPQPQLRMAVAVESVGSPRMFLQGREISAVQERVSLL